MTDFLERGMTAIAAHRAGAGLWPENSPTAFRNAFTLAVEFIEFDIHRSRDGALVVHHDPVLGRTVEGNGAIADLDWCELRRCSIRRALTERMPLLAEILPMFDGSPIRPRLELKTDANGRLYPGMTRDAVAMLRSCALLDRVVITSFDQAYLDEARNEGCRNLLWLLNESATAAFLRDVEGTCRAALARGIEELSIRGVDANAELVARCRAEGMVLGAYAGKDMNFDDLLTMGLSVFTSDRPDLALTARQGLPV